jgi:hypothetical protein
MVSRPRLVPPYVTTMTRPRRVLTHLVPLYAMTTVVPCPRLFLTHIVLVRPSTHDDDVSPSTKICTRSCGYGYGQ